jgi:hypothetical protein
VQLIVAKISRVESHAEIEAAADSLAEEILRVIHSDSLSIPSGVSA